VVVMMMMMMMMMMMITAFTQGINSYEPEKIIASRVHNVAAIL
jgi:hypothetical protein